MTKHEILVEKMHQFRELMRSMIPAHPAIRNDLESLSKLFAGIESGQIGVPSSGIYRSPFPLDVYDYCAQGTPLLHADAEFKSALEDWPSKPWYPRT